MNHPFPGNIPLLRKLYEGRFSTLLFLVPFYRTPEPDVITVYRGSYTHAAYLTDARERLAAVDCDYYMAVHDDVLLNPKIGEPNFREIFPLGPRDGYISHLMEVGGPVGDWTWLFGFAPKALFPKSHLFGSGIESETLRRYLPSPEQLAEKFRPHSARLQANAILRSGSMPDVEKHPSRTLLHGYAADIDPNDEDQVAAERHSLDAERSLVEAMKAANRVKARKNGEPAPAEPDPEVALPIPIVGSSYFADCYIVPKPCFDDYAHCIGVASAANLFVELMVPTLLVACCDHVFTARDFGIDTDGFTYPRDQKAFRDPRFLGTHPFKLSGIKTPTQQRQFLGWVESLRAGEEYPGDIAVVGVHAPDRQAIHPYATAGWHAAEDWGRWAAAPTATIRFVLDDPSITSLELLLRAPLSTTCASFEASYSVNGQSPATLLFDLASAEQGIVIERAQLRPGRNVIELVAPRLVRPCDLDPSSQDDRPLGLALLEMRFNA